MTSWLAANMVWASAAMLLVMAVRQPFARLFGAGPAYALWLIPALRLVMPPLPSFAPDLPALVPAETLVVWVGDTAAPLPPDGGPGQWGPWLLALWAGGAAVFLAWQWLGYRRFLTELSLSSRSVGAHRGLPLIESGAVQGPVALGLLDRRIVVPADFETRYSSEERRLALDHEAVHHRRGDIWWNHLGLFILALNWFNPVAWLAFRAFRADQELACDARVTALESPDARHDYARALIKSASRPGLIAACPLNHADQLKRRLKMMKSHRQSRARMLGGAAAVAALAAAGLALGSPGFAAGQAQTTTPTPTQEQEQAAPAPRERHEERVIVRSYSHRDHDEDRGEARGQSGSPEERREERRIVIMDHHRGGEGHADARGGHGGHGERMFRMHVGEGSHAEVERCADADRTEFSDNSENQQTRVIVCNRGNATPAQRAERLQGVRDRLARDEALADTHRTRVTAALDREIARLRGQ